MRSLSLLILAGFALVMIQSVEADEVDEMNLGFVSHFDSSDGHYGKPIVYEDFSGKFLCVLFEGDVIFIDINDPSNPDYAWYNSNNGAYADTVGINAEIVTFDISGNYLYAVTDDNDPQLEIINIEQPKNGIYSVNQIDATTVVENGEKRRVVNVKVSDDYLYVSTNPTNNNIGNGYHIMEVWDISNPESAKHVGVFNKPISNPEGYAYITDMQISGDYAYLAAGDLYNTASPRNLIIVDISNPTNPTYAGEFNASDPVKCVVDRVTISGDYAYIVGSDCGMQIIDVSDPTNPIYIGGFNGTKDGIGGGIIRDVVISGNYLYASANNLVNTNGTIVDWYIDPNGGGCGGLGVCHSIIILNISNPTNPSYIGAYIHSESSGFRDIVIYEGYVYSSLSSTYGVMILGSDGDGDGFADINDFQPSDSSEWADTDGDGIGDNSDKFPNDANETTDSDGDGVGDNGDAFPNNTNEWEDTDGDGRGDNGDAFPNNTNEWADSDGDGMGDNSDAFPNDPNEWVDTDSDGIGDNSDDFPRTSQLDAWWQAGAIGLILTASGAVASYRYDQYKLKERILNKKNELEAKIAELKEKGIKTDELESILEEA